MWSRSRAGVGTCSSKRAFWSLPGNVVRSLCRLSKRLRGGAGPCLGQCFCLMGQFALVWAPDQVLDSYHQLATADGSSERIDVFKKVADQLGGSLLQVRISVHFGARICPRSSMQFRSGICDRRELRRAGRQCGGQSGSEGPAQRAVLGLLHQSATTQRQGRRVLVLSFDSEHLTRTSA